MAKQRIPTNQTFTSEEAAWKEVMEKYSVEKNYIMRNAKKAGKKVSVGVERIGRRNMWMIVIYVEK